MGKDDDSAILEAMGLGDRETGGATKKKKKEDQGGGAKAASTSSGSSGAASSTDPKSAALANLGIHLGISARLCTC